jgi:hypothetical protein
MKPRYIFFQVIFLISFAQFAAAQRAGTAYEPAVSFRNAGDINIHAAVGSSNGVRPGMMAFLAPEVAVEASLGYVRIENKDAKTASGNPIRANGLSATMGLNYFTHPEYPISPLVSLLFSYNWSTERIDNIDMQRFVVTPTFGASWCFSSHFSAFIRTGPSVHFLSKNESGLVQTFMNWDGGFGWTF